MESERGLAPSCFGATFDRPLQVIGTGVHVNRLPAASGDPTATEPGNDVLSGVKKAETGDEFVIRLYETQGTRCTASVQFKDTIFGEVDNARDSIGFEVIACFSRDRRVGPREALAEHPEPDLVRVTSRRSSNPSGWSHRWHPAHTAREAGHRFQRDDRSRAAIVSAPPGPPTLPRSPRGSGSTSCLRESTS